MSVRYLFNTAGNYVAFQQANNVFSPSTDWVGFIVGGNQLYSTDGDFLGYVLNDDRVARDKTEPKRPRLTVMQRPPRPMRPLRPIKPLRRLRKPRLPFPYEDVFEDGLIGAEPRGLSPDVSLNALIDSKLFGGDDTFLGNVNKNPYDIDSLSNQFGQYGNSFSSLSIFNDFAQFGNPYSHLSPLNEFSRTPPRFVKNGQILAYLTVNQFINPRIDPKQFKSWLGR